MVRGVCCLKLGESGCPLAQQEGPKSVGRESPQSAQSLPLVLLFLLCPSNASAGRKHLRAEAGAGGALRAGRCRLCGTSYSQRARLSPPTPLHGRREMKVPLSWAPNTEIVFPSSWWPWHEPPGKCHTEWRPRELAFMLLFQFQAMLNPGTAGMTDHCRSSREKIPLQVCFPPQLKERSLTSVFQQERDCFKLSGCI